MTYQSLIGQLVGKELDFGQFNLIGKFNQSPVGWQADYEENEGMIGSLIVSNIKSKKVLTISAAAIGVDGTPHRDLSNALFLRFKEQTNYSLVISIWEHLNDVVFINPLPFGP